jgi:glucosamine-6-phosphate deaminase
MNTITARQLYDWCIIPASELENHPDRKVPFRISADSAAMGALMARELADLIAGNNAKNLPTRAIIPCGPACWYKPFAEVVNHEQISLRDLTVFHMDECLDWQGRELPRNHPYSFRGFMEREFYGPIEPALLTPEENRWWPNATNFQEIADEIARAPIDITYGGWGQDGHIAYNQARRHPFSSLSLDDLRNCSVRVQDNNLDTIIALAQRTFGCGGGRGKCTTPSQCPCRRRKNSTSSRRSTGLKRHLVGTLHQSRLTPPDPDHNPSARAPFSRPDAW